MTAEPRRVRRGQFSGAPDDAAACRLAHLLRRVRVDVVLEGAVAITRNATNYSDEGILDGEGTAGARVDAIGAALQPITHYAFIVVPVSQLVIAVLAATFGALALRVARRLGTGFREWDRRQPR